MFDFVFQGITVDSHAEAVKELLRLPKISHGILSVAFATENGVAIIEEVLQPVGSVVDAYVGIRNDITSAQGLKRLAPLVNRLFVVDTGGRSPIFHPKVYLARSKILAKLVVGSANLTTGGLWNNIEASVMLTIHMSDAESGKRIESLEALFESLAGTHPQNVILINSEAEIDALLEAGRVVDEDIAEPPRPARQGTKPDADPVPRMRLFLQRRPVSPPVRRRATTRTRPKRAGTNARRGYERIWESKELTERDLNIPTGPTTNPTGSMLFKKGRLEDIDQRHFFRDEVFDGLNWQADQRPGKRHLEHAEAIVKLIIKNIDYGEFSLRITHNTKTNTASYLQNNSMTSVSWGSAAEHVRQRDLLGRTLYLYRDTGRPDHFIIEID